MHNINLGLIGIMSTLLACQEAKDTGEVSEPIEELVPEEEQQENPEEEPNENPEEESEEEAEENEEVEEEISFSLPNLLQCASQSMGGQTIRMFLQNVYGQAHTEFQLGHTHDLESNDTHEILDHTIYQSVPILGEDTIDIDLISSHHISEEGADFFGGDGQLSLSLWNGLYSGTLSSPNFGELEFHCWEYTWERIDDFNPDNDFMLINKEYSYDHETGLCKNALGEEGYNHSSVVKARETGDAECVDMNGWSLEEQNFGYPNLDWNVRGALMNGAQIHFANMIGADFSGADMTDFEYGYTSLQGIADEYTQLPIDCLSIDNMIDCMR